MVTIMVAAKTYRYTGTAPAYPPFLWLAGVGGAAVLRRGFKWIFRYGEPETVPLPSRLWLFGMYVVM